MRALKQCFLIFFIALAFSSQSQEPSYTLQTKDIRIRDPYIYKDSVAGLYYMYAQVNNRLSSGDSGQLRGVEVYISKDLISWSQPKTVLSVPDNSWANQAVWAPEMHAYNKRYYIFVTLTSKSMLPRLKKPAGVRNWPKFNQRGTQIFVAESPLGPFTPFKNRPHTPPQWMALDGTLFVENDIPYMVFCREWVEVQDGTMELIRLSNDLSETIGMPHLLFKSSSAPWSRNVIEKTNSKVTDGPFLFRTKTNQLLMIWSAFGENGYATGQAISESGSIKGPWKQQPQLLFEDNGGHGMIFKDFNGELLLVIHQPNSPGGQERAKFFKLIDEGDHLEIKK